MNITPSWTTRNVTDFELTTTASSIPENITGNVTGNATTVTHDVMMMGPEGCLVIPRIPGSMPYENPEDLVTYETQMFVNDFVTNGLLTVLFVLGVPANAVNMIVFFKQGLKERINVCLFCLSLADLLVVGLHFVWSLDWAVQHVTGEMSKIPVLRAFINNNIVGLAGFIYLSSFISMIIAIDRCICVVYPFKARSILSAKAMAVIILVACVVIVGSHFVISAGWRVICIFDPLSGTVLETVFSSKFYFENKELVQTMDGTVFGLLIPGICLTGVVVATVFTVMHLHKMAAWRDKSVSGAASSVSGQEVALTRMLIGISVLFIVCTTPPFIFHTAILFVPDLSLSGKYYNTFNLMINTQQALIFINSSVNFAVYYSTGTKYRNTLNEIFRCCGCCFKVKGPHKYGTTSGTKTTEESSASVTVSTVTS